MEDDKIMDFSVLSRDVKNRADHSWVCRLSEARPSASADKDGGCKVSSGSTLHTSYWSLLKIHDSCVDMKPKLVSAIRIFPDMHVEIFVDRGNNGIGK